MARVRTTSGAPLYSRRKQAITVPTRHRRVNGASGQLEAGTGCCRKAPETPPGRPRGRPTSSGSTSLRFSRGCPCPKPDTSGNAAPPPVPAEARSPAFPRPFRRYRHGGRNQRPRPHKRPAPEENARTAPPEDRVSRRRARAASWRTASAGDDSRAGRFPQKRRSGCWPPPARVRSARKIRRGPQEADRGEQTKSGRPIRESHRAVSLAPRPTRALQENGRLCSNPFAATGTAQPFRRGGFD